MPTLDWLNRAAAFTTAARVPYRLLEPVSVHTATAATPSPLWGEGGGEGRRDNLLIQGDNLEALKALLAVVEYKGAHLLNDPYEIEKRQIGELWARKSQRRCLFGQIAKERDGVGMSGQLDALLA